MEFESSNVTVIVTLQLRVRVCSTEDSQFNEKDFGKLFELGFGFVGSER